MLELTPNCKIDNIAFLIREITKKVGQNSKEYYSLQINRGLKNYDAKIWSGDEKYKNIKNGDAVKVKGIVKEFKGNIQIHISELQPVDNIDEVKDELLPFCTKTELELRNEFNNILSTIKNENILKLLNKVFNLPDIQKYFFEKSAGSEIHHAYVRGLAEHSIEVAKNTIAFCSMGYPIKYDTAVTIALLHDIGKVYELSDFPDNKYTDVGKLLGHISIGANLVSKCIDDISDFPKDLAIDIIHGMLSHHGNKEMGSPVVPMTLEAIAVHNADKASAEINAFYLSIKRDNNTSNWTDYNNIYKRAIKKY